jgi:hypothetical protein
LVVIVFSIASMSGTGKLKGYISKSLESNL